MLFVELFECTVGLELVDFFSDLPTTNFPPLVAPAAATVEPSSESESEEEEIEDAAESLSADEEEEAELDSLAEDSAAAPE